MSEPRQSLSQAVDDFLRRRPLLFFAILAVLAFLCGPLGLAASKVSAVLYKDF